MKYLVLLFSVLANFVIFSQDTTNIEKEIFNKINNYRVKIGKPKFTYTNKMVSSCRSHSSYMNTNWTLVHVKSLSEVGANAEIIQLNTTMNSTDAEVGVSVLDIFIKSPSHKKIIEGDYKQISVGVFVTSDDDLWVTIRFI
jgi:uncharacterized protein YkwD